MKIKAERGWETANSPHNKTLVSGTRGRAGVRAYSVFITKEIFKTQTDLRGK